MLVFWTIILLDFNVLCLSMTRSLLIRILEVKLSVVRQRALGRARRAAVEDSDAEILLVEELAEC